MKLRRKPKLVAASASAAGPAPAPARAPAVKPAPAATAYSATGELDLRGLGRILWEKKTKIAAFTLIVAAAAFVVVNAITPRYRSESRLLLEVRENVFLRAEADKTPDRMTIDAEAVASQSQVVMSRDLARQVIAKENLADNPEFDSPGIWRAILGVFGIVRNPTMMSREERTLEAYYERLRVSPIERSRVIAIEFTSADPELAARVANSIAETYLTMQQAAKQSQTREASNWLASEIEKMRQKVAEAEAKVEEYRSSSNLFVGSNNTSLPRQQLTEINSQIAAARGQKADLEARARRLRELIRSGTLADSSDIANSESMRRLIDQRTALRSQLAEQSTTLLDQHPRIKELRAQIGEIDRQMRSEAERLARQFDNDAKVAGDRLESLTASLDQVKRLASQTNEQDVQLRALERDAKTQRELLESYMAKHREAAARDSISAAPAEARIISRASPALQPAYPKKTATILIAAFAALALSSGFVVTGALLSAPSMPSAYPYAPSAYVAPAYPSVAMPVMSAPTMAPTMPPPPMPPPVPSVRPAAPAAFAAPPLPIASVEQVARMLREAGENGRRVAVVGTARNAGTTYTAITLARALAKDANVALVDLAFGAPNLSVISTDPSAPGIAELVRGMASFGDIITRDQFSNVHLVATGQVGTEAQALAASPMLGTVIEALALSYGHVVMDAGFAGDERLAPLAQRAVLVAAEPAHPATRAARERLMQAGYADVLLVAGAAQAATA